MHHYSITAIVTPPFSPDSAFFTARWTCWLVDENNERIIQLRGETSGDLADGFMHSEAEAVEPTETLASSLAKLEQEAATQVMQKLLDYVAGRAPELDDLTYRVSADEYDDYL